MYIVYSEKERREACGSNEILHQKLKLRKYISVISAPNERKEEKYQRIKRKIKENNVCVKQ